MGTMDTEDYPFRDMTDDIADIGRPRRERSQIEFPYTDIGQAQEIVQVLYDRGGGSADREQLAVWMDQSAVGGTFRSRISAAAMFGFIRPERGRVQMTALGREAVDPSKKDAALADAFLRVELFKAMFDKYQGYALPPAAAIERQMVELGVPEKQKVRARQTFQKSALLSGFVDAATGRFVRPVILARSGAHDEPKDAETGAGSADRPGGGSGGGGGHHPFIEGLLTTLPEPGAKWPAERQAQWLQTAASIFGLIYTDAGGTVKVAVQRDEKEAASTQPTAS